MILTHSKFSRISAQKIAAASNGAIRLNRGPTGDVNWGRATANTKLNPNINNATDKYWMLRLFEDKDVPMPLLIDYPYNAVNSGITIVGRPDRHSKGRGFWLCNTRADVDKALRGTRKKKAATHFMEYIKADREFRVHILNGKSIRISEKDFTSPIISNMQPWKDGVKFELGFTARKPTTPVRHIRKAAKQAVAALGLDFGAVDVLEADGKAYVLEVNAAPGLGGTLPALYASKFLEWSKALEGEYGRD